MKAIIFDLDGTLINSLEDIALSMNEVLVEFGYPPHKVPAYNYFVGDGALVTAQRALPEHTSDEVLALVVERFKEVYDLGVHNNTKPYKGIYKLLEKLETLDLKLGILSNKPHEFTKKYAENLFSTNTFVEVHGQKEHIPKKPDPAGALYIANELEINPCDIIYVGDTATDIKTAKAAGMKSIGVLWGFRPKEELQEHGADFLAKVPNDIFKIIKKLSL